MAISDIKKYAHLSGADVEALGRELDSIRRDTEESLGAHDARYIHRVIAAQRLLSVGSRALLFASNNKLAWVLGTGMLSVSKIVENMELAHNITHGQWDWMNDPEIHSTSWEWDMPSPSAHWKHSHNFQHHKYTNVIGMDDDIGFGILRMTRDEQWRPIHLVQPLQNVLLAAFFEWGIALHDLGSNQDKKSPEVHRLERRNLQKKAIRQLGRDYVLFPALSGRTWKQTLTANIAANLIRNVWAYAVIFCGHFPDGAEKFTLEQLQDETQGEWYLRQMLGSANFEAGPALALMSGNLCYQIEHHVFPDLPSNRYVEISERVQALCEKYDLPYTTGSMAKQYWLTLRTIHKLALPDSWLLATADDAPETNSERKFRGLDRSSWHVPIDPETGERYGLRTAVVRLKAAQKQAKIQAKQAATEAKLAGREAKRRAKVAGADAKLAAQEARDRAKVRAQEWRAAHS